MGMGKIQTALILEGIQAAEVHCRECRRFRIGFTVDVIRGMAGYTYSRGLEGTGKNMKK